eukprot:3057001-Ditylum_brightwellii.AAC.1
MNQCCEVSTPAVAWEGGLQSGREVNATLYFRRHITEGARKFLPAAFGCKEVMEFLVRLLGSVRSPWMVSRCQSVRELAVFKCNVLSVCKT